jgi:hypothetical protein
LLKLHRAVFKQFMQHYDDVVTQQVRLKLKIKVRLRIHNIIRRSKAVYSRCGRVAILAQAESLAARQAAVLGLHPNTHRFSSNRKQWCYC